MDIKRKAYDSLIQWKNSSERSKAIMIKGARRVGKSYLAEQFAKREYRSYILIDFASPLKGTIDIFNRYGNRESLNEFFNQLSVLYGKPLYERSSVIIFDEIQKYPRARELVKYLVADGRYDYIETGSLISIKKNVKDIVIPSEEEEMLLHPLDFEEFLNALSDYTTVPFLRDAYDGERVLKGLLRPVMEKLRVYMLVGGMPQAVSEYVSSGNIDKVERIKRGIIKLYREDIAKYAEGYVAEATAVFNAIPSQLSHHDKKIKFAALKDGGSNLYVATSKPEIFARRIIEHYGLARYFSFVGGGMPNGARTKKSEVISYVLQSAGIGNPEDAVMVGDRSYDIAGAKTVGLSSIGVLYGYGSREELENAGADAIAERPGDIIKLIL